MSGSAEHWPAQGIAASARRDHAGAIRAFEQALRLTRRNPALATLEVAPAAWLKGPGGHAAPGAAGGWRAGRVGAGRRGDAANGGAPAAMIGATYLEAAASLAGATPRFTDRRPFN